MTPIRAFSAVLIVCAEYAAAEVAWQRSTTRADREYMHRRSRVRGAMRAGGTGLPPTEWVASTYSHGQQHASW